MTALALSGIGGGGVGGDYASYCFAIEYWSSSSPVAFTHRIQISFLNIKLRTEAEEAF